MKKFRRDYDLPEISSPVFKRYFDGLVPCVYDIETGGLSRTVNKVILTAMLVPTDRGVSITQFLAEDHYEEDRVLTATMDFMREMNVGYIVTYNGLSFDAPFTNQRLSSLDLPYSLDYYDLDLYRFLKRYTVIPGETESMSQKSVESYYGISSFRKDTISGRESVAMYNEYVLSGDGMLEKVILTHNREDVLQLYRLLLLASYGDFGNILKVKDLHAALSDYGFPVLGGKLTARTRVTSGALKITGRQISEPVSRVIFADSDRSFSAEFNRATSGYDVTLPLSKYGNSLYTDLSGLDLGTCGEPLTRLSGHVNGSLIIKEDGEVLHEEMNALAAAILGKIAGE